MSSTRYPEHLALAILSGEPGDGLAFAAAQFLNQLYFKKPHFPGLATSFDATQYEAARNHFSGEHMVALAAVGEDPIEHILDYVYRVSSDGASSQDAGSRDRWLRAESTLNTRFIAAVAFMEPPATARVIRSLLPAVGAVDELSLVHFASEYRGYRADFEFGQPDCLLGGPGSLCMIEMKVRGFKSAKSQYDPDQLVKYMLLAAEVRATGHARQVTHLILEPRWGAEIFYAKERWVKSIVSDTGQVIVDADGAVAALRRTQWRKRLGDPRTQLAFREALAQTPVYVASYRQLRRVAREHSESLAAADQLEKLDHHSSLRPRRT